MRTHMKMGRLGVWAQVDCMTASAEAEFARDVEQWGYSALWTPEAMGRDVLVNSGWLLANTRKLVIASGIANIGPNIDLIQRLAPLARESNTPRRVSHAPTHGCTCTEGLYPRDRRGHDGRLTRKQ